MGIFNRIKNIVASELSSHGSMSPSIDDILASDDDELRRIIDELTRDQEGPTRQAPPPPTSVPANILAAHTVLNVPVGASHDHIKKAYRTSIAAWHPDRFANASAEEHAAANARARDITSAYQTLKSYYGIA
jgi:hypothetical protein